MFDFFDFLPDLSYQFSGKKETDQAAATLEKINGNYGLVVCSADLAKDENVVRVPLQYFLSI